MPLFFMRALTIAILATILLASYCFTFYNDPIVITAKHTKILKSNGSLKVYFSASSRVKCFPQGNWKVV